LKDWKQYNSRALAYLSLALSTLLIQTRGSALGNDGGAPAPLCIGPYPISVCDCVDTNAYQSLYAPFLACGQHECLPSWESQYCTIAACANVGYSSLANMGNKWCKMYLAVDCDGEECVYDSTPAVTRWLTAWYPNRHSQPCTCNCACIDPPPCPTPSP
jgi:hypothetical protein